MYCGGLNLLGVGGGRSGRCRAGGADANRLVEQGSCSNGRSFSRWKVLGWRGRRSVQGAPGVSEAGRTVTFSGPGERRTPHGGRSGWIVPSRWLGPGFNRRSGQPLLSRATLFGYSARESIIPNVDAGAQMRITYFVGNHCLTSHLKEDYTFGYAE